MADSDFHVVHPDVPSMDESQMIAKHPEVNKEVSVTSTDVQTITQIVNKQTLKAYRAGYEDGYVDGLQYNEMFSFGYGIAVGLSLAGLAIIMISNK